MTITLRYGETCFNVSTTLFRTLMKKVNKKGKGKEIGGMLYGYKLKGIEEYRVVDFTSPFSMDKCAPTNFYRKDKKHLEGIRKAHNKNVKIMYLGEWHSHPVNSVTPSSLDDNTWNKLSITSKTSANRLIFLIVTTSKVGYSFYDRTGNKLHENSIGFDGLLD